MDMSRYCKLHIGDLAMSLKWNRDPFWFLFWQESGYRSYLYLGPIQGFNHDKEAYTEGKIIQIWILEVINIQKIKIWMIKIRMKR